MVDKQVRIREVANIINTKSHQTSKMNKRGKNPEYSKLPEKKITK